MYFCTDLLRKMDSSDPRFVKREADGRWMINLEWWEAHIDVKHNLVLCEALAEVARLNGAHAEVAPLNENQANKPIAEAWDKHSELCKRKSEQDDCYESKRRLREAHM
jgi:hypothetical protein